MNKVAVFLATGFEEIEAISIIDVLRRGGVELDIVSDANEALNPIPAFLKSVFVKLFSYFGNVSFK